MDKLSRDATAAIKAGMSYGKYMAMKDPVKIEPPKPQGIRHECQYCGKVFYRQDRKKQKFCSDTCRERANYRYTHKEEQTRKKVCPVCGKEFEAKTWRSKYCGAFCSRAAQVERVKEYQKRKAEGAANV